MFAHRHQHNQQQQQQPASTATAVAVHYASPPTHQAPNTTPKVARPPPMGSGMRISYCASARRFIRRTLFNSFLGAFAHKECIHYYSLGDNHSQFALARTSLVD